jgi:hypothetical protein
MNTAQFGTMVARGGDFDLCTFGLREKYRGPTHLVHESF